MDDTTLILNRVLPILFLIGLGHWIRRSHFVAESTVDDLRKLVVTLALPSVMFISFLEMKLQTKYLVIFVLVFAINVALFALGRSLKMRLGVEYLYFPFLMTGFEYGMLGVSLFGSAYGLEKIGYIASRLATQERPADKYREVKHLGRVVEEMVHDALDAFARMDAEAALRVARQDRLVDEEYEAIQRQGITFMMEDPRAIRRALDTMWIVRALERIGDHAKNICEYVIYMVHGKDVRHVRLEDVETQIRSRPAPDA
mgnify:CR=1 FL=1